MNKIVLMAVSMYVMSCLTPTQLFAQQTEWSAFMEEIALNNKTLKAYQSYIDARNLSNRTMNSIDDMELSGAYLPLGNHDSGHFMEFQLSQTFEFPSAYRSRTAYMEQDMRQQEIALVKDRQEVLVEVNELFIELIYQQKRKEVEAARTEQAKLVFDQITELYKKEQVGKLDLNKAKVAWLQQQFSIEQIDADISRILTKLNGLNGGQAVSYDGSGETDYSFFGQFALASADSLWNEKVMTDPFIRYRDETEKTALAHVAVQEKERLPQFDIGMNYEGVKGDNFAGFSGGLTIPIWNRKNTIKAAQAHYIYEQQQTDAVTSDMKSEYNGWYGQYSYLLGKYYDYQSALDGLDSEELLTKAYELGELSYLEYYMELRFYQDAYDELLVMERDLHLIKNKLLKHNL